MSELDAGAAEQLCLLGGAPAPVVVEPAGPAPAVESAEQGYLFPAAPDKMPTEYLW
jgi:hypothetical protein